LATKGKALTPAEREDSRATSAIRALPAQAAWIERVECSDVLVQVVDNGSFRQVVAADLRLGAGA
jgi:hypothetical protein